MRLVYKRNYTIIDSNMTDSNMGTRSNRRSSNNILLIQSIIHETLNSNDAESLSLQIMDYRQMFDTTNLKKSIGDLYDIGFTNEHLYLLYEANC